MNILTSSAIGLGVLMAVSVASAAQSAVIGNWDGGARSWNTGSTLVKLMESRGHKVEADGGISAAGLAGDAVFVIGEAKRKTTTKETADLSAWIKGGGRLLVSVDSGRSGVRDANSILSALGSSLKFAGSAKNGPLQTGNFLTDGGPFDIVGKSLQVSLGTGVKGGTSLAGSYVGVEAYGSGFIFGFGDEFAHDVFSNSEDNVNGQMHVNLVEASLADGPGEVPVPAPIAMLGSVVAGLGAVARRRMKK